MNEGLGVIVRILKSALKRLRSINCWKTGKKGKSPDGASAAEIGKAKGLEYFLGLEDCARRREKLFTDLQNRLLTVLKDIKIDSDKRREIVKCISFRVLQAQLFKDSLGGVGKWRFFLNVVQTESNGEEELENLINSLEQGMDGEEEGEK